MIDWAGWNLFRWGTPRALLPKSVGLYVFVGIDGSVLYVGSSSNIWNRVRKHEITKQISMVGVLVYWKPCSTEALVQEENLAINLFKPSMNSIPGIQTSTISHYENGGSVTFCTTPEEAVLFESVRNYLSKKFGFELKNSQVLRLGLNALAEKEGVK